MKTTNHTVIDLNKVAYANAFYRNQHNNMFSRTKPKRTTVNGTPIVDADLAHYHPDYPHETLIERARRLGIIDKWLFVCKFQLSNGHTVEYTGEKGKELWKAWNQKIFRK